MTTKNSKNIRPGDQLKFTGPEWFNGHAPDRYEGLHDIRRVTEDTFYIEGDFGSFAIGDITKDRSNPWGVDVLFTPEKGEKYVYGGFNSTSTYEVIGAHTTDTVILRGQVTVDYERHLFSVNGGWSRLVEEEAPKVEAHDSIVISSVAYPVKDAYGITDNLYIEKDDLVLSVGTLDTFLVPYELVKEDRLPFSELEPGLYGHQEGPSTLVKKSEDGTWKFPDRNHTPVLSAEDTAKAWYNQRDLRKVGFVE